MEVSSWENHREMGQFPWLDELNRRYICYTVDQNFEELRWWMVEINPKNHQKDGVEILQIMGDLSPISWRRLKLLAHPQNATSG